MPESFHDAMQALFTGDADALNPWLAAGERSRAGLSIYRNTVASARADALSGLVPTIQRLVGADWFRSAALAFAVEHPPQSPVLDDYGRDFPAWLAVFPPARPMAYLAPVARLDLAWSLTHRCEDAPALNASHLAGMAAPALFASRVVLHPSAQIFWFDWTVPSIWLSNRPDAETGNSVAWTDTAEGLLIARPGLVVTQRRLSRSEWMFLDACRHGRTLGQAATAALGADPYADLSQIFADLLSAGVFTRLEPEPPRP